MLLKLFDEGSKDSDISVIEGVMGFYDGDEGSAYRVSEITGSITTSNPFHLTIL